MRVGIRIPWSILLAVATSLGVRSQIIRNDHCAKSLCSTPGSRLRKHPCPEQWISHSDSCYQFVFSETKPYSEAVAACWVEGSALVSVNSVQENIFISEFLRTHARESAESWYTSGQYISGSIKWYGDGSYTNHTNDSQFWQHNVTHGFTQDRIIYRYSAQYRTFRWMRVNGLDDYNYICEISKVEVFRLVQQSRGFDYGSNTTDISNVQKGPGFIVHPESLVVVGADFPAYLECSASGHPQPEYTWYETSTDFNKQTSGSTTEVSSSSDDRYTLTSGHLAISKPDETMDAGLYQCKAYSPIGSILSEPVRLSFGYLNQYSPNTPGAVVAKRNQGSFINCLAPSAKPALAYDWYKGSVNNFIRPELNKYYFVSANGNLYLSEVQDSDAGSYYCVVTLIAPIGMKLSTPQPPSRTSKAFELVVVNSPAQEYGPIIHPDFINVYPKPPMANHEVRMECFAYGRMPMRYSWFREGKNFPPGTYFKYDNRVLVIPKARLADSGNYTCKVEKLAGLQKVAFKSFLLVMEAKPYFVVSLKHMHADVDSELTWRCEVMAIPRATYSWYKNSKLLEGVPGEIEIRENVLVIKRLNADRDNGMYQCMATNSHGTSMSSAQLRVLSIKPSFAKYPLPSSTVTAQGGNLTIHCTPEAAPAPDITWLHNNQPIGYSDGRSEVLLDGTLHLTQVTPSDSGYYTCKASNINGEAQSTTQVSVFGGIRFSRRPIDSRGHVNQTVFLYCQIAYDYSRFDLAYVWKFNGRIIDTRHDFHFRLGESNTPGLYIINAQFYHTGRYTCIGQTVSTSISASARVTITGPPAEPAGVFVEGHTVQNRSVRLAWTWNPAANHGYPVKYFHVEARTEFSPKWEPLITDVPAPDTVVANQPMRHFVDLHDLLPHNSYQFRLRAINDMGVGPASRPSEMYRVPSAAPVSVAQNVGGGEGSVGLLCMSWQPLSRQQEGGMKFGYKVFWKLANDTKAKPKVQDVGNTTFHCETVGEKNYYLLYSVQVQAYNIKGLGPISPEGYAYSAEGMPANRPSNVNYNPINATAMTVYWNKVPSTREAIKGKVKGYRIDFWEMGNPQGHVGFSYVYCDCGEGLLVALNPDSDYWLRVSVFNSAGLGVPSEKYLSSTNQSPASLYPQFVTVYPHGEHSVKVTWREVSITISEGALKGYKLLYWPVGDDIRSANFTMTDRRPNIVIYGLQQDIIYKLRVMAFSLGGDGKKSPTVYFTILKGGAINVNLANFDPSTSQMMLDSAEYHHLHLHVILLISILHFILHYIL